MKSLQYRIITLDAMKFLDEPQENVTYSIVKKKDGVWGVDFFCDLSKDSLSGRLGGIDCVISEGNQDGNALFYQILSSVPGASPLDINALRKALIFVDFRPVFRSKNFPASEKCKEEAKAWERLKEDSLQKNISARLRWMLEGGDGIRLTFEDGTVKNFIPFDKSGNMSRRSHMSFVDRELKAAIDQRLLLGLDFSKLSLIPSKYYAYRGLYLSTGFRIEGDGFVLDEDSVIVIKDKVLNSEPAEFFHSPLIADEKKPRQNFQRLTAFDGEGVICPEYAGHINACLKTQYAAAAFSEAHTFQIRLPFTKGVLHEVDFLSFFDEYYGLDSGQPLLIEDAFGETRDLRKAKIILTESMFKCGGWLRQAKKKLPERFTPYRGDIMAYYFAMTRTYDHALYVTGLDSRLTNNGTVRLNYQFLSTLELREDEFEAMLQAHIQRIREIPDALSRTRKRETWGLEEDADEKEEWAGEAELAAPAETARDKCLYAISKNSGFLKSAMARDIVRTMTQTAEINLGKGRITVSGEQRFLSNDLLGLLEYISELISQHGLPRNDKSGFEERRDALKAQLLRPGRFYMPEKAIKLKQGLPYGFLRSPHLSRNEQCVLVPHIEPNGLYQKYFSHLTGVVMVANNSIVPMALSGADFDGDLVKIVCDLQVLSAMKRSHERKGRLYKRKLPVVCIPSDPASPREGIASIPFDTVIDTFQNQVGMISNLAVEIAKKEYTANTEDGPASSASCTVVVGMEIDAAKSGKHPEREIQALKKQAGTKDNLFLELKKKLSKKEAARLVCGTREIARNEDGRVELYLKKGGKEPYLQAEPLNAGQPFFALDTLPILFLNYLLDKKAEAREKKDGKPDKRLLFRFEQDKNWRKSLDKSQRERVGRIILSYQMAKLLERKLETARVIARDESFGGYIVTILRVKFDDGENAVCSRNASSRATAEDLCALAILDIFQSMGNRNAVRASLQRMSDENWQFTEEPLRARVLSEILSAAGKPVELDPDFTRLAADFDGRGYMLLYFILKEVLRQFESLMTPDDFEENEKKEWKKEWEDLESDPFYRKLEDSFRQNDRAKRERAVINAELIRLCREELETLFGPENMDTALMYVFSCKSRDSTGRFLWDIFTKEELSRSILACEEEEGARSAQ